MARFYPHPRDFICVRENDHQYGPMNIFTGGLKVPLGKIFVPVAIGSKLWLEAAGNPTAAAGSGGLFGYQRCGSYAAISYVGESGDHNTFNHVAGNEIYSAGVFGVRTDTFQTAGKFASNICPFVQIPFGVFYRENTEILVREGSQLDYDDEWTPPETPAANTDVRLYGYLCDA